MQMSTIVVVQEEEKIETDTAWFSMGCCKVETESRYKLADMDSRKTLFMGDEESLWCLRNPCISSTSTSLLAKLSILLLSLLFMTLLCFVGIVVNSSSGKHKNASRNEVNGKVELNMRYVAAALLATLGDGEPNAANIKKILSSDGEKVDKVAAGLAGKKIEELIAEGTENLKVCALFKKYCLEYRMCDWGGMGCGIN